MTTIADATGSNTVEQLTQVVKDLQKTVKQQAERIEHLEKEVEVQSSNIGGAHNRISDVADRVAELESSAAQGDPAGTTPDGAETGAQAGESHATPLDQLIALPEHLAERELSANQERARFVARDVRDYAEKAPAGLVIDSSTIKKVITAAEGTGLIRKLWPASWISSPTWGRMASS